jgi:hypothetical protein
MAIGAIFEGDYTQAQYDRVNQQLSPDNRPPPGMLYHAAGPTEHGFCVIEVWESQEAMRDYFEQQLGAVLQQESVNVTPKFFSVTNIMKA